MNTLVCFCPIILIKNYFISKIFSKMKACDFYKHLVSLLCYRVELKEEKQTKYVYIAKHLQ